MTRTPAILGLAPLLLAACSETQNPLFDLVPGAGATDPEGLMAAHVGALEARDADRYANTLADEFRFVVRADVVDQFPWISDGAWGLGEELTMIGNLLDPRFEGEPLTVQSIDARLDLLNVHTLESGTLEWTYQLEGTVFIGEFTAWALDARLVVHIVEGPDGYLRIAQITEVTPGPTVAPGALTWGTIKAKYR